MKTVKFT